jgi:PAS domain S-box-containing protein
MLRILIQDLPRNRRPHTITNLRISLSAILHAKKRLRRLLALVSIASIVSLTCIASSWAGSAPGREKTIKAVFYCDYAPVSFWDRQANMPYGFFVDVMDNLAGGLGLNLEYICKSNWPEMISAVESGEADLAVLMKSPAREKIMLFSTPIEVTYLSFFARSQSSVDEDQAPAGYTVGVVRGSMSYELLKDRPGLRLQTDGTYKEGIFSLLAGQVDLFAGEDSMILKSAKEAGLEDRIRKVGKPFAERERGLAVRKNNRELLEQLNKALQEFVGSPEYQRSYLKWYGTPGPYWTVKRLLVWGGGFLFIAVCGMALWRYHSIVRINKELTLNINERKQAERMLTAAVAGSEQEKAKSDAVIAAIGDGLVIVDRNFKILYQNEVMRKMIGNLVGETCYKAGEGRQTICENCAVELSFRDGQVHRMEKARTLETGTIHMDITSSPLRDAAGEIVAVIEMVRDITERKLAEEVLRRYRNELEILVGERTAELTMMNYQLRNLSAYLQKAREEERTRISHEVHDELGQALTALKIDLSFLKKGLPRDQQAAVEKVVSMSDLVDATIQSVKRISTDLRPGMLDHLGITAAVEWQAEEFAKRTGIPCTIASEPEEISLDRDRTTTVFRIFQETLTNVARHAKATQVAVLMRAGADGLTLEVRDNGKGITESQVSDPGSLGLLGIRERVNDWGGSLTISGSRDTGTTVAVRIPL